SAGSPAAPAATLPEWPASDSCRGGNFSTLPGQYEDRSRQRVVSTKGRMAAPLTPSDSDLLRRLRAGDEKSFGLLYHPHVGPLFRYALRMSGSAAVAEDVTQEAFMALIHQPEGYDASRGPLPAYLHGVARHHVLRRLEREGRYVPIAPEADG